MTLFIILISINSVNANEHNISIDIKSSQDNSLILDNNNESSLKDFDLETKIQNANKDDEILIEPGHYCLHNINLTKSITLSGKGNPKDIIIDGENQSSIFLIRSNAVHVTFKNITFINAKVTGFGGAISMETGHVYVDNCNFINNTASVNAGGISNYGNERTKGYLFVNNSLFVNNYAGHDGGAITTCYANSYVYNSVFISNSAHRDGGAIRVSVQGYGNFEDCIFMYNHADEWGGAYYSWSGTSKINRCIFLNNTAGTNGGAVMVSGNLDLGNSIIMDNTGGETGGSFYIQQPMYDAATTIKVHDNLITNNSSPYGKEIFIKWDDVKHLFTRFNNNDWGDEDPNDSSVIDPDKVTTRSKVTSTIKSNLLNTLNLGLLTKYADLIGSYFPDNYIDNIKKQLEESNKNIHSNGTTNHDVNHEKTSNDKFLNIKTTHPQDNINTSSTKVENINNEKPSNSQVVIGNSTSQGEDDKSYELNESSHSAAKKSSLDIQYFIAGLVIVLILLGIGYKRNKKEE